MTMWDILIGACFFAPITAAVQAAKASGAHGGGYVFSLMLGVVIGFSFAFSMRSSHRKLVKRSETAPSAILSLILVGALIVELAWIGVAGFVGWSTTSVVLNRLS